MARVYFALTIGRDEQLIWVYIRHQEKESEAVWATETDVKKTELIPSKGPTGSLAAR